VKILLLAFILIVGIGPEKLQRVNPDRVTVENKLSREGVKYLLVTAYGPTPKAGGFYKLRQTTLAGEFNFYLSNKPNDRNTPAEDFGMVFTNKLVQIKTIKVNGIDKDHFIEISALPRGK
jgi:hypothetical protein